MMCKKPQRNLFYLRFQLIVEAFVQRCFVKKMFLGPATLFKKDSGTGVSCEFWEISKNNFLHRAPLVAASVIGSKGS